MGKKRVMVDMSATIIHHWHIRIIKKATEYWEVIVGLATDEAITGKKGYIPELNYAERKEIIEAIKYVTEVVPVDWLVTDETLKKYKIDLLVHGDDNQNKIKKENLLVIPRTAGISTTELRERTVDAIIAKHNSWLEIPQKILNKLAIWKIAE